MFEPHPEPSVEVRTSAFRLWHRLAAAGSRVCHGEGQSQLRYGIERYQDRLFPLPGELLMRGFPPQECPGCSARLWLDSAALDLEKVFLMSRRGALFDMEALPWRE